MKNLDTWNSLKQPPKWALREIKAGRLKGKSDINPQWRYQAMTENFGMIGQGWNYYIKRVWQEEAPDNQIFAFAEVELSIKINDEEWSDAIPGIGGSMLVAKESGGLHANDEAYKMAVTDALSVAMKMVGVGADVYSGAWDGSKYIDRPENNKKVNGPPTGKPTQKYKDEYELLSRIGKMKKEIIEIDGSDKAYYEALSHYGVKHASELKTREDAVAFGTDLKTYIESRTND